MAPVKEKAEPDVDPLRHSVVRFGRRRERWLREQPRALAVALSVMGTGWTIVIPTIVGLVCGRYLDSQLHTGVALSAAAGFVGLCLGSYGAWHWIWRNRPLV
jgi:ATP synthase protein I